VWAPFGSCLGKEATPPRKKSCPTLMMYGSITSLCAMRWVTVLGHALLCLAVRRRGVQVEDGPLWGTERMAWSCRDLAAVATIHAWLRTSGGSTRSPHAAGRLFFSNSYNCSLRGPYDTLSLETVKTLHHLLKSSTNFGVVIAAWKHGERYDQDRTR